ncbi:MAG: pyridoxal-phosphate dependent enzyme, partial [Albidovulum sp.]
MVLPETVDRSKLEKICSYGVEIILHGAESGKAEAHAQVLASSGEYEYISPYNDTDVIAGQGTIGLELLEQANRIDNIFISMGGGGLISGIGSVLKSSGRQTRVIGVSAQNSAALAASMVAGKVVDTDHLPTLADGVAGGMDADSPTLPMALEVVDKVLHCSEDEIAAALRGLVMAENILVEGAAVLALAGFMQ